jgi:hydrogenase-4 component F
MTLVYIIVVLISGITIILNRSTIVNYAMLILFIIVQCLFPFVVLSNKGATQLSYFTFDSIGILLLCTLSIISIPAAWHGYIYIKTHNETRQSRAIYFSALIMLISAISLGVVSNHIAFTWIFTEITTLAASALIYHHRNKLALEGTWKYIFICAISITFVYVGILFLNLALRATGSHDLSYASLMEHRNGLNTFWLKLSFLFIFTGFTAKMSLVPMFTASIDAKDTAPAPAGALLATGLINLGFIGFFRIYVIMANTPLHKWTNILIGTAGILSVFMATVYMLRVKNIKRMLAYSGMEHMGIVMIGIVSGGIGYYAAILHIILHSFIKSGLFFQFTQIYRVFQNKNIYYTGYYFRYNVTGAIALLAGFFCITAIPPSGMFVSEFLIFKSLFDSHMLLVMIVLFVLLTTIIWAFGKNVFRLLFQPPVAFDDSNVPVISPWESTSQFILFALAVWLGFNPPPEFVSLIKESVMLLPN